MSNSAEEASVPPALARLADHWGLVLAFGVVTVAVGIAVVVWPERTLVVLAVLLGIQLIIGGVFRIIGAFTSDAAGGMRALMGLLGALSALVGLLCLRAPLQSVAVIGLLLGGWWAVSGILDVFTALFLASEHRVWRMTSGAVSAVVGIFLLVNPEVSLSVLVIVVAVWLFGYGGIAILMGLRLRSQGSAPEARPEPAHA